MLRNLGRRQFLLQGGIHPAPQRSQQFGRHLLRASHGRQISDAMSNRRDCIVCSASGALRFAAFDCKTQGLNIVAQKPDLAHQFLLDLALLGFHLFFDKNRRQRSRGQ